MALCTYTSNYCRATEDGNTLGEEQFNVTEVFFTSCFCQMADTDVSILKMCVSLAVLSIWC